MGLGHPSAVADRAGGSGTAVLAGTVTPLPNAGTRTGVGTLTNRAGKFAHRLLLDPSKVAGVFWLGGMIALGSVLVAAGLPRHGLRQLALLSALCATCAATRLMWGSRLPRWTLHLDLSVGIVTATLLGVLGAHSGIPFADLYVWAVIYVAVYFRPHALALYLVAIGIGDAVVLIARPPIPEPVVAWLALFGTITVAMLVVHGLVTVLRETARQDPLTGVANRRWWSERLEEELARCQRCGEPLSVIVADLDGFKVLNDRAGHAAGDRALCRLATAWRAVTRVGGDFVARIGGDEFAVLAAGLDANGVDGLLRRLEDALPPGVECSFGSATWDRGETSPQLVARADQEMYRAKALRHRARA